MITLEKFNAVLDYVEENILEELDVNYLASIAACSAYDFQRTFSFAAGMSIAEYIRKRRLTLAGIELQRDGIRVIDAALKYGYDSPVSFTRAFRELHGITPSEARISNTSLKAFPRMTFQIIIKGVSEMNYRIVKTNPLRVFGLEGIVSLASTENGITLPAVWEFWDENFSNGKYDKLFADAGEARPAFYDEMFIRRDMCRIHGLFNYKQIDADTHGYMQFCFIAPKSKTSGYKTVEIPASTWAVFSSDPDEHDPGMVWPELYRRFYREWLPASEFEKADSPEFEMYCGIPPKICYELWMPIIKKT